MDMSTLHAVLRSELLELIGQAGETGIQILDLFALREGAIRVGDQILLSSVAARLVFEQGETNQAIEILGLSQF